MTARELISTWTEEERTTHADLISECLERERFLGGLRGKIRASEGELQWTGGDWTGGDGGQVGTVFTRFINAFSFCPEFGKLQRSKHPTAGQSPLKASPTPGPVSSLNRIELAGSDHDDFPSAILVLKSLLFYNSLQ